MVRLILASVLLTGALGCQRVQNSTLRFSKDLFVTATGPVNLPVAAVKDTYHFVEGGGVGAQAVLFLPVLVVNLVKHAVVVAVHPLDAAFYPLYLPLGLKPTHHYTIDNFPYTTAPYVNEFFTDPFLSLDAALVEGEKKALKKDSDAAPPRDFFDVD